MHEETWKPETTDCRTDLTCSCSHLLLCSCNVSSAKDCTQEFWWMEEFLSSIRFGLFFFSTLTRNNQLLLFTILQFGNSLLYTGLWLFFVSWKKTKGNRAGNIPVQAPAPASLLWGISAVLQEDWPCSSAKHRHHDCVCYSSAARMPYTFQNTFLGTCPRNTLPWLQLFVGRSFLNSKTI